MYIGSGTPGSSSLWQNTSGEIDGWLKRMIEDFPEPFETDPYWHDLHWEVDGREALEWFKKWFSQFRSAKE